ncbi:MAG: 50S ribosomal protein L15 [bacterium]|nr:MAG: 50S ribosomal protein L15 [bacterium]
MKLSDIRPAAGAIKRRKRIGCGLGSGHGRTATKGTKGQNCRSGGGVPPWFEGGQMPLQRRVPKRGFTNIFKTHYQVVNLSDLARFESGAKVNRGTLLEKGLIKKANLPVKLLGRGELTVPLDIEVDAVSRSASSAVTGAGGTIRLVSGKKPPVAEAAGARGRGEGKPAGAEVEGPAGSETREPAGPGKEAPGGAEVREPTGPGEEAPAGAEMGGPADAGEETPGGAEVREPTGPGEEASPDSEAAEPPGPENEERP